MYFNNATSSRSKKLLVNTFLKQKGNGNHVQYYYGTIFSFIYGIISLIKEIIVLIITSILIVIWMIGGLGVNSFVSILMP